MVLNGQRVTVQAGDIIHWDEDAKCVVLHRPSNPAGKRQMRWFDGSDNKGLASFLKDEREFWGFVQLVAEMLDLGCEQTTIGTRFSAYRFI